jgi:hypothetical protein
MINGSPIVHGLKPFAIQPSVLVKSADNVRYVNTT